MTIIDTNIILRFLLRDQESLYQKARTILKQDKVYLDATIIAETVWVLASYYQLDKAEIVEKLSSLINLKNVSPPQKQVIMKCLSLFHFYSLSFIDTWLLALHVITQYPLSTFDQSLSHIVQQQH